MKMKHGAIRVRTKKPDFSDLPAPSHDWSKTVYGDVQEELPTDAPPSTGQVRGIHNLRGCQSLPRSNNRSCCQLESYTSLTRLPLSGLQRNNQRSRLPPTDQNLSPQRLPPSRSLVPDYTLRYLGVPVEGPTYVCLGTMNPWLRAALYLTPHSRNDITPFLIISQGKPLLQESVEFHHHPRRATTPLIF